MFLENKYTTWYYQIITRAQNRISDGYVERHHIIPKCLDGADDPTNLVRLTAREHYICHLLLTKMTVGMIRRKMLFAHWRMVHGNKNQSRYQLTNRQYEDAKQLMKRAVSEQNKGFKQSEETIAKLRNKIPWNKGKTYVMSMEARMKISAARTGTTLSAATRKKISESSRAQADQSRGKCQSGKPKYRWVLQNKSSGATVETINLRKWCSDHQINSAYIYTGRSDWMIIEKYNYKTNSRIV